MHGFVLSRHSKDTEQGISLSYWLATDSGPVCLTQTQQQALCFLPQSQQQKAQKIIQSLAVPKVSWHMQSLALNTFTQGPAVALYVSNHKAFQEICGHLRQAGVSLMEQDIRPQERYMMERFISASLVADVDVNVDASTDADAGAGAGTLTDVRVKASDYVPKIKALSLDIETTMDGKTIHSIAVYGQHQGKVVQMVWLHWPTGMPQQPLASLPGYTQTCVNERQLLKQFSLWLQAYDPDAIIGWALVQFDFQILCARARELGVRLRLGRGGEEIRWRAGQGNRPAKLYMPGRVALDGIEVMRSATWQFESFALENVAQQLLGRGKDITKPYERGEEIQRMYRQDPAALVRYNLEDCRLVWDIFIEADLMAFLVERARLTGLPMDRIGGSSQAFDHLYLPKLHRQGYVAPAFASGQAGDSPGGFVMDSKPGLYRNVLVLDFKSLYPSIIRSFKIDPLGLIKGLQEDDTVMGYKGARFSRQQSILPDIIRDLWAARDIAKQANNTPLSTSIKIVMNSCYGVLGSSVCRFYDQRLASSITLRGHAVLNQTKDLIQQHGLQVIYGDTDSVFVWLGDEAIALADVQARGRALVKHLNDWWSAHLTHEFNLKSYLEIEFETYFSRFIMPTIRGQETGSKKRYAGITVNTEGEEKMLFKGLEQVRTDWTKLARELQAELYDRVFHDQAYDDLIKPLIAQVRNGQLDHKLVYRKRLRRPLADYQKNVPPHVQAARKADAWRLKNGLPSAYSKGGWIEYVITLTGPEPLDINPTNYDYEHYIERQIEPVVDGILPFLNDSFANITERQLGLF
jgi:DNA polymerase-2